MAQTIEERLARIETKLDTALAGQRDQEQRIRVLERVTGRALGAAAIIGAGVSVAANWLIGQIRGGGN